MIIAKKRRVITYIFGRVINVATKEKNPLDGTKVGNVPVEELIIDLEKVIANPPDDPDGITTVAGDLIVRRQDV